VELVCLAYSDSELISGTTNLSRHLGITPWMGDRPIARPLPIQDRTTHMKADIYPCLEWNSTLRFQFIPVFKRLKIAQPLESTVILFKHWNNSYNSSDNNRGSGTSRPTNDISNFKFKSYSWRLWKVSCNIPRVCFSTRDARQNFSDCGCDRFRLTRRAGNTGEPKRRNRNKDMTHVTPARRVFP
jgi:hypothetical protein